MQPFQRPPIPVGQPYPLFNRVSIETLSRCNRNCWFCPISTGRRDFETKWLPQEVFDKIVIELAQLQFDGVVQMFLLNEPLLDKRMLDMLTVIHHRLPKASTYISTNGDALDNDRGVERLGALFAAGANAINLNVYDTGDEGRQQFHRYYTLARAAEAAGYCTMDSKQGKYQHRSHKSRDLYVTDMRLEKQAGVKTKAENKIFAKITETRNESATRSPCPKPHRHLVILHDGSVPLCCQGDPTDGSLPTLGNVAERGLWDVWQDPAWRRYRYHLPLGQRTALRACATCRAGTAYAHNVQRIEVTPEELALWHKEEILDARPQEELSIAV